jgi:Nucleotidyltransferase of unknown function (DUF6036)
MKPRADLDPGYVGALSRLFKRIERLLDGVDPKLLPLRVYVAGGAATFLHTGERPSRDLDASFSLRVHLPADLEETYTDRDGNPASVYLDANYNDSLGPAHEDAFADAERLAIAGLDPTRIDVRVLAPVDLAISKLGRFGSHDRDDVFAMARAGLLDAAKFERRAKEALKYYVGHPAAPRANLRDAVALIRAHAPKKSGGDRRSGRRRAR